MRQHDTFGKSGCSAGKWHEKNIFWRIDVRFFKAWLKRETLLSYNLIIKHLFNKVCHSNLFCDSRQSLWVKNGVNFNFELKKVKKNFIERTIIRLFKHSNKTVLNSKCLVKCIWKYKYTNLKFFLNFFYVFLLTRYFN